MPAAGKERLDEAVVRLELAPTRSKARAMIMAGDVLVNGLPVLQAGSGVRVTDDIALKAKPRFVSRGGLKLDHALDDFAIGPAGLICADFGASTGGFTDCLLQRDAKRVYALDVAYGELAQRIRDDDRVVVEERINVRYLNGLPEPIDLVVIDVSFISLALVLPAAKAVLKADGVCVPLVKPQFEAGKGNVGKRGVVRDPAIHRRVLVEAAQHAEENGFGVLGVTRSPITGPAGNIEFLLHLQQGAASVSNVDELIGKALAQ